LPKITEVNAVVKKRKQSGSARKQWQQKNEHDLFEMNKGEYKRVEAEESSVQ
jgi:hypothetical protein